MAGINLCEPHDASFGEVYDIATWSKGKEAAIVIMFTLLGLSIVAGLLVGWYPTLIWSDPPAMIEGLHRELLGLWKTHPWSTLGVSTAAGALALLMLTGAAVMLSERLSGKLYYLRMSPAGFSFCAPGHLDFADGKLGTKDIRADIPSEEVEEWRIKRVPVRGSRKFGPPTTVDYLQITTVDGRRYEIRLDDFVEPTNLIYSRLASLWHLGDDDPHADTDGRNAERSEAENVETPGAPVTSDLDGAYTADGAGLV